MKLRLLALALLIGVRGLQPHPALVSCGASELSMQNQRVLILCIGNSARSQMAEGLLRHDAVIASM